MNGVNHRVPDENGHQVVLQAGLGIAQLGRLRLSWRDEGARCQPSREPGPLQLTRVGGAPGLTVPSRVC